MKIRWMEPPTLAEYDAEDKARREDEAVSERALINCIADSDATWECQAFPEWFPGWDWTERPLPYPSPDEETEA